MESIISTFHIDWKIIIAQAINFGVVFVVLYIFALKPLSKLMAERSERIAKGMADAKTNAEILEKTAKEHEAVLAQARAEANKIFEDGRKEALAKKALMLEEAKSEVAATIENGKKMLEGEKIKMVGEAKKEISTLAIQIAEKLIGEKVGGAFNEKTIKELNNL